MAFTKKEQRNYWRETRNLALDLKGRKCSICGKGNRVLVFHRIDGKLHSNTNVAKLVLEEPDEFTLLCRHQCHVSVHWCMKYLGMTWDDIMGYVAQ